jgi:phosphoribosylformylglycinamidine synthase
MTTSVIDEAVRRVIAVGGELDRIAILDNFCWPDPVESEKTPDGAYKMAQLVRSCKALYDLTTLYKTPAVSGKDSCKNDSTRGGKKISIPPTLLISSVGQISDVGQAVTMPFKAVGDLIYVVGETYDELGASAYYRWLAEAQGKPEAFGGAVPQVQGEQALALYRAMNQATAQGLLQSATSPSKGGLALALALATIGSEQGAQIDLSGVASDATVALFSESNSRFVISVKPEDQQGVEALFAGGSLQLIGEVVEGDALTLKGLAALEREAMRQRFKATLAGV